MYLRVSVSPLCEFLRALRQPPLPLTPPTPRPLHKARLLTYLKLAGYPVGLLLNFNVPLMKNGVTRLLNNNERRSNVSF